jgi:hypothetical protein
MPVPVNSAGALDAVRSAPTCALRVRALAEAAVALVDPPRACQRFLAALSDALEEQLLPFATEVYADLFRRQADSGEWMATFLLTRLQRKASDARRLRRLGAGPAERALLDHLAVLDSDHARDALALFELAFPDALDRASRSALAAMCPAYPPDAGRGEPAARPEASLRVPDDLLDLFLDRLRGAVHGLLLAERLPRSAPRDSRPSIEGVLREAISRDLAAAGRLASAVELADDPSGEGGLARRLAGRMHRFERLSVDDPLEFQYSLRFGQYP